LTIAPAIFILGGEQPLMVGETIFLRFSSPYGIFSSSQYSGAKKFDFYQKSNFWVAPPRFIEKIRSYGKKNSPVVSPCG